jgi:hypothetical protein
MANILEQAVEVREKKEELERSCKRLRDLKGDWTCHAIAASNAMKIADDGLKNTWVMLDRLNQLAKEEIARISAYD